jgi:hypothetical protein
MLHMVTTQITLVLRVISSNPMEDLLSGMPQSSALSQNLQLKAELLSLSAGAGELMAFTRYLQQAGYEWDMNALSISCDNRQTVDAINKDAIKLTTKLRHTDIHQHWLRQLVHAAPERLDARDGYASTNLKIEWIATADMAADGLTKRPLGRSINASSNS